MTFTPDPRLKTFWEKQSGPLHALDTPEWFDALYAETRSLIGRAESVVDAGCGSGELLERLAGDYPHVEGFDLSSTLVARAQERLNALGYTQVPLRVGAIEQIDELVSRPVDVILCSGVVQYLRPDEAVGFLVKATSKLNPGGRVVMTVLPNRALRLYYNTRVFETGRESVSLVWLAFRWAAYKYWRLKVWLRGDQTHFYHHWYSMKEMERVCAKAGFRVDCSYMSTPPYGYRFNAVAYKAV